MAIVAPFAPLHHCTTQKRIGKKVMEKCGAAGD